MKNVDKLSLEYSKCVNNEIDFKLIFDKFHNINKDDIKMAYQNFDMSDYIGFDLDSLDYYENWLGEDV